MARQVYSRLCYWIARFMITIQTLAQTLGHPLGYTLANVTNISQGPDPTTITSNLHNIEPIARTTPQDPLFPYT